MKINNLPVIADVATKAVSQTDDAAHADFASELDNKMASVKHKHDAADSKRDKPAASEANKTVGRFEIENLLPGVNRVGGEGADKNSDAGDLPIVDPRIGQLPLLMVQAMPQSQPQPVDVAAGSMQAGTDTVGGVATHAAADTLASLLTTAEKGATDALPTTEVATAENDKAKAPFTLPAGAQKAAQAEPVKQNDLLTIANNNGNSNTSENSLTALLNVPAAPSQTRVSRESAAQDASPLAEFSPLANASTSSVSDAAPKASAVLSQELGTPAWQNSLSQQISVFTRNGIHDAELRLHPQELGAVQINLRLNNDQVQLHFVTENHQVRAAMEAAMPHLRTTLAESGLNLEHSSVGADASSSGGFFSQSGHEGGRTAYDAEGGDAALSSEETPETPVRIKTYASGINTFV